jgi:hypothetical protein
MDEKQKGDGGHLYSMYPFAYSKEQPAKAAPTVLVRSLRSTRV